MKLKEYKDIYLLDIADMERVEKNKIYNKGNIIIQISATKGQIFYLEENQKVENKYIILKPKRINNKYLYYILQNELPNFLKKYQTDLNIQPESFKFLKLKIHTDLATQKHIAQILTTLDEEIKENEQLLNKYQNFKKYHLEKMFV